MSIDLFKPPDVKRALRLRPRARRLLLIGVVVACYIAGVGYHVTLWRSGAPPTVWMAALYNLVIFAGYGTLWALLSERFKRLRSAPGRTFWTTLLIAVLFMTIARLIASIGSATMPAGISATSIGFDYETHAPLAWATVVKMNLIALVEVTFAFLLLLRFRELVFFKRTRSSQRNWYLMLALMLMVAVTTFFNPPNRGLNAWQSILVVPAVAFMVINSFRLSWIAFLSFREKMASIGLSLLLLIVLATGLGLGIESKTYAYLGYYSNPIALFVMLTMAFGILYCTTALLSLLFHLPTTSDFQQKASEIAAMHSLTNLVNQVFDADKLATTIAASPVQASLAQAAWVAMADPRSGSLQPKVLAAHGITPERVHELIDLTSLYDDLTPEGQLLLDEAPTDHRVHARPGGPLGSLLVLPLTARGKMLGALFAVREMSHGFEKDDLEALHVFAAQAALALDNARLFEEQIERERLSRELAIAREVQRRLLPQHLPELPGLTVAAASVPALEVGGDYYDFVRLDDHRLAIIIADVSGKGTSAAFYMAEMQGIFRALSGITSSPHEFLSHANRALAGSLEKHVFISVIYGVLDLREETFTLARAGHCPAAHINLNGEAHLLRTRGMGLGLSRDTLFTKTLVEEQIRLQPGDVVALYTDGVVESRNANEEEYGYDRLLTSLREHRHEDVEALHDGLLTDLHTFIGHEQYDDDMTLVVLKWHGVDLERLTMQPTPRASSRTFSRGVQPE